MSREDWEVFDIIRRERKLRKEKRRNSWQDEYDSGFWTRHHSTHYSCLLLGDKLDYWPGPMKWRWREKTMRGDVKKFIEARMRENAGKDS